ncbi:hypothetical protein BN2476_1590002 [Paraburkholderia piptadeniae]|uniref:Uncharacterized protein n=1 Tax=Paraburkholderia piptadeniae TaxID=1701573 RepID=A0A1N7SWV5_9BURK|nr:hypothetical protein BN2476_1590002 [Paraburkholderia piptadeniae]
MVVGKPAVLLDAVHFGWLNRFRRLARDYERLPETLAGLHFVVFAMLMLVHAIPVLQGA